MIYIVILIVLIFGSFFEGQVKRKRTRFIWYFAFIYLTALSAFGYRIGADMPAYIGEFDYYKIDFSPSYFFSFHRRQPLWVFLFVGCKSLGGSFELLKIIQAIFLNFCVFRFIDNHSKNRLLGVLFYYVMFYLHFNFNSLRSSIALSIFLLSYDLLLERKYIKYYIFSVLSFFIHTSAVVLFLFPLLNLVKIKAEKVSSVTRIVFFISLSVIPIGFIVQEQISSILGLLQAAGVVNYGESYFENDFYTGFALSLAGLVEFVFTLLLYLYIVKDNAKRVSNKNNIEIVLLLLYVLIFAVNTVFPILYRLNDFISIILVCAISNTVSSFKIKSSGNALAKQLAMTTIIIFLNTYPLFVTTTQYHAKPISQFYPYYSIFDKKISPERERVWGDKEYIEYIY